MNDVVEVQKKILEIMKYIDSICRKRSITYFIMGGTALGAIRHGGFIPWDDDLDIFMTPSEYDRFKAAFLEENNGKFVIQEWNIIDNYRLFAKVRMNGTTFIEHNVRDNKEMHHGIYVDIMTLHKVPNSLLVQRKVYYESKYATVHSILQRGWKAKTKKQKALIRIMNVLPNSLLLKMFSRDIYRYDNLESDYMWCYWTTKASFKGGLFPSKFFEAAVNVPFEDTELLGSNYIKDYLEYRYGDYMRLPSDAERIASVHAEIYDVDRDYTEYLK